MAASINVSLERVRETLDRLRTTRPEGLATTDEVIAEYMGGFHSNLGVAAQHSWNAQFGKILKAEASNLGIREISSGNTIMPNGHKTHASLWNLHENV